MYNPNTMNRQQQNQILREWGYKWAKITGEWLQDNDDFENRPGWVLRNRNGSELTVEQAFRDINNRAEFYNPDGSRK